MKRSDINTAYTQALACFKQAGWALPPEPRWDITDYGLQDFERYGLVLVNLADEPEYCEKLMYAQHKQTTPMHAHKQKKEDVICRWGRLTVELWEGSPEEPKRGKAFEVQVDGKPYRVQSGEPFVLDAGERVTLTPGVYHTFWPESEECVIGEVSTANDDRSDNIFVDPRIGRFPEIEEDEPAKVRLVSE